MGGLQVLARLLRREWAQSRGTSGSAVEGVFGDVLWWVVDLVLMQKLGMGHHRIDISRVSGNGGWIATLAQ